MTQDTKKFEVDIKSTLLNHLKDKGEISKNSTIISELTLNKFSRRVDLAILEKGRAYAFEIKSASDSLYRLEGQVQEYLNYFDKVVIVAAPKHTSKILSIVPKNVAVWELRGNKIAVLQRGKIALIDSLPKTIDLLKANELQKLSNKLSVKVTSSARKHLEESLLALNDFNKAIRAFCLECIGQRYRETSQMFLSRFDYGEVVPEDINLLSRTRFQREKETLWKAKQTQFWESFAQGKDAYLGEADIALEYFQAVSSKLAAA